MAYLLLKKGGKKKENKSIHIHIYACFYMCENCMHTVSLPQAIVLSLFSFKENRIRFCNKIQMGY